MYYFTSYVENPQPLPPFSTVKTLQSWGFCPGAVENRVEIV